MIPVNRSARANGHQLQNQLPIIFRTCAIQHFTEALPYVTQDSLITTAGPHPTRCIWLPQYHEAKILLEKFIHDIDHLHHVVHTPSLPSMFDQVYASLSQQSQIKPGNLILLLAIFGSCTNCWGPKDCARGLDLGLEQAQSQAQLWVKSLEDVLDVAHRTTSVSLEGVQGIIIAVFVLFNLEGYSRRSRSLYNMSLLQARELGLYCLDHPSKAKTNTAQAEMGRRVWWYLVSCDWYVNHFSVWDYASV